MVENLVRVDGVLPGRHFARQHDHRRTLHQRAGDARDGIRQAGTECRDEHRRRASELVDGVRHEGGGRLALGEDECDSGLLAGTGDLQHVIARDAKGEPHAICSQRAGDGIGDLHHSISL